MPKLELTIGQVIELVKQLSHEDKSAVLHALDSDTKTDSKRKGKSKQQEQQLRDLSAKRGLNWDGLSEDDREVLAHQLQR